MSQMTSTSFHENTMAKEPMDAMPMAGEKPTEQPNQSGGTQEVKSGKR